MMTYLIQSLVAAGLLFIGFVAGWWSAWPRAFSIGLTLGLRLQEKDAQK